MSLPNGIYIIGMPPVFRNRLGLPESAVQLNSLKPVGTINVNISNYSSFYRGQYNNIPYYAGTDGNYYLFIRGQLFKI
ncbi:MAG: hypothetical protein QXP04_04615, partial [Candidatus Nanoarchaeia archaeon]|nr:hypothetical protein [Candidatus Jingweiarchaeum tengchongense]